jgi:hypothetical protein
LPFKWGDQYYFINAIESPYALALNLCGWGFPVPFFCDLSALLHLFLAELVHQSCYGVGVRPHGRNAIPCILRDKLFFDFIQTVRMQFGGYCSMVPMLFGDVFIGNSLG